MATAAASTVGRSSYSLASTEGTAPAATVADPNAYFVDTLFRSAGAVTSEASVLPEAAQILANAFRQNVMPAADQDYSRGSSPPVPDLANPTPESVFQT
jgi:hypothetical protein